MSWIMRYVMEWNNLRMENSVKNEFFSCILYRKVQSADHEKGMVIRIVDAAAYLT